MNNVFGLDIGTRNVVGTVGYQTDDKEFVVTAQYVREHETRAMLDGQIHDIGRVAKTIKEVKDELEKHIIAVGYRVNSKKQDAAYISEFDRQTEQYLKGECK